MKVIIVKNYEELSRKSADLIIELVKNKPDAVLGLATGSTPLGLYKNLIAAVNTGEISFKDVKTLNLDEYVGLDGTHNQSYRYFMNENLFNSIDINIDNTFVPGGCGDNLEEICANYNFLLDTVSRDVQLLGLGGNGHIGFNEPGTPFSSTTHVVTLKPETRKANARFFNSPDEVPTEAVTMGIKNVLDAKSIILVASGTEKANAVNAMLNDEISETCPASALRLHPDVTVVIDEAAASKL